MNCLSVAGAPDTYIASTLSFLPRNIASLGSLHQSDMFPPAVARAGSSTPIRDEEGGSTPVLDEPDDDDIPVAPSYSTPMVLSDEGKSTIQQNLTGGPHALNPEFSYRIVRVNDGIVGSQRPDENGSVAAPPPPDTFSPDGTVVYRTEVVDGFQSASEAFHPPPDFFCSETDFSVPPPMTIYQVKDEGFVHASESLPVLSSSTRDVVYTVVTTVQQPAPASYYPVPVVIEVPPFSEPPPKLTTFQPPPASFVHPPPTIFNPSLPPPTLPPSNLQPQALPPPTPPPQPVSVHYTVPPPANIQVVVPPHTLRSPLPAPPKSGGPPPIYVPKQLTSNQPLMPTVRTLHSSSDDRKTSTASYQPKSHFRTLHFSSDDKKPSTTSYQSESVLQGIRHIRESQQKYNSTSVASVKPTVGVIGSGLSQTQHKPTQQKSPVGGRHVPSLLSLRQPIEVARRMSKGQGLADSEPLALFAGSKRKLSGSISEDSLSETEAAKIPHDFEGEPDAGLTNEDIAGQLSDDVGTDEIASETGNGCEYAKNSVEDGRQIPSLVRGDRRIPFHGHSEPFQGHSERFQGHSEMGGGPRFFGVRRIRAVPPVVRYRMPRIPRMSRPVFRGGPLRFWGGER